MKNLINFILFMVALTFFVSCNINGDTPKGVFFTIEGYIYNDCSMTPFANEPIQLWQDYDIGLFDDYGGVLATATTDANGYFKFEYQSENLLPVLVQTDGGNPIIGAPRNTNIHDLVAFRTPTCNIQVSLNVINSHSEADTLYIKDFTDFTDLIIPGPFESGVLYTALNVPLPGMNYEGTQQTLVWFLHPYPGSYSEEDFVVIEYCNDTIKVVADIE